MKRVLLADACALSVIVLGACTPATPLPAPPPAQEKQVTARLDTAPLPAGTVDVPSSARSRAAVARVEERLGEELSAAGLRLGAPVFLRIFKHDRHPEDASFGEGGTLELWLQSGERFYLFRSYPICYFSGDLGPKLRKGDNQAPEGFYFVRPRQMNPASRFHLSFNLGYPNSYDRTHGRSGSALMVHGNCVSIGCYAMGDPAIEEIWTLTTAALRHQQPFFRVHIFPFRMSEEALALYRGNAWHPFWAQLKQGYDHFETHHVPPDVGVEEEAYTFRRGTLTAR